MSVPKLDIPTHVHEVDHLGFDTFQLPEENILFKRSSENLKVGAGNLSARGFHHRSRKHYQDLHLLHTNTIRLSLKAQDSTKSKGGGDAKKGVSVLHSYFTRGLCNERLHNFEGAKRDYEVVVRAPSLGGMKASAYNNLASLLVSEGKLEEAEKAFGDAIKQRPVRRDYRVNRSLVRRRRGRYIEATKDILAVRAVNEDEDLGEGKYNEEMGSEAESPRIDPEVALMPVLPEDPIIMTLKKPPEVRWAGDLVILVEFLKQIKFFAPMKYETLALTEIARRLILREFIKGQSIFEEGDPGDSFYIVLEGVVALTKIVSENPKDDPIIIKRLYRGEAFGETSLREEGGKRSAGAFAEQPLMMVSLSRQDYSEVIQEHSSILQSEVRKVISSCNCFRSWKKRNIKAIASTAVLKVFSAENVILKAGDDPSEFYIIKSGVVKLFKPTPKAMCEKAELKERVTSSSGLDIEHPGLFVLGNVNFQGTSSFSSNDSTSLSPTHQGSISSTASVSSRHSRLSNMSDGDYYDLDVGVLGPGQVFNELAILNPYQPSPLTAKAFSNVELYCIPSDALTDIGARFNTKTSSSLSQSFSMLNPPCEKMAYYFRQRREWEKKKKVVLDQVMKDHRMSQNKLPNAF